jgi:nucleoside-diphosphate-sugar epimerase
LKVANNNVSTGSVYVLGGNGFLGSRFISRLNSTSVNYVVGDLFSNSSDDEIVDVENPASLGKMAGFDCIVNLAALHRDDILPLSRYDDVNVEGAINVCEAACKFGISRIIFTSSVAIFGFAPPDTDESGTPNFFNGYGRTKYLAEQVYKQWQSEDPDNRSLVIVRPTVIFGEGNRGNVYNLLNQIASRRFVMFGNGKNKKSMAYVENVAAFLEYSLSFKSGVHIYNYIDKPDFDMNNLVSEVRKTLFGKHNVGVRLPAFLGIAIGYFADLVSKLVGKTLPISRIRVKKFMSTTQFSSSAGEIGFVPPVSLEEGLARTLRYEFLEDNADKKTFESE